MTDFNSESETTGTLREVRINEKVLISEAALEIEFVSVIEDSRCPKGVNCIWAGNGKIEIGVNQTGRETMTVQLNTELEPKSVRLNEYEIKLITLDPYPQGDRLISADEYSAVLLTVKIA